MYQQFFAGMPFAELPLFALLLFFTTFVGVVVRVSARRRRAEMDRLARLPLDDGRPIGPEETSS
jgi:cbb3-type cytochrome oxidase subunit 3